MNPDVRDFEKGCKEYMKSSFVNNNVKMPNHLCFICGKQRCTSKTCPVNPKYQKEDHDQYVKACTDLTLMRVLHAEYLEKRAPNIDGFFPQSYFTKYNEDNLDRFLLGSNNTSIENVTANFQNLSVGTSYDVRKIISDYMNDAQDSKYNDRFMEWFNDEWVPYVNEECGKNEGRGDSVDEEMLEAFRVEQENRFAALQAQVSSMMHELKVLRAENETLKTKVQTLEQHVTTTRFAGIR